MTNYPYYTAYWRKSLPYLRLIRADAPIGYWLLLWPCWLGLAISEASYESLPLFLFLFLLGTLFMRSAGCIFNDIADRDFDRQVIRTSSRPLATGEVSIHHAILLLVILGLLGLMVLLQFNKIAIWVGVAAVPLILAYPFMKRITWWPQLWLGLTFNWGALLSSAAVAGEIFPWAIALYISGIFWTLGYDTIYAHQDKESDVLIGIKSSALRLGPKSKTAITLFYASSLFFLYISAGLASLAWPAFVGLAAGGLHLVWQIQKVNLDDPKSCLTMFKSNNSFAAIVFIGFIAA
ncbi:MAG: 4-hydroxybenzoate octaprenyltransferase [Pseudomonadota bacterium]|nr:4-hydroxybenzoate octaprenyltransferase [Pseudomonadota bacterium]